MKSADIRQSFLDYFAERGHRRYPSSPLVPHGDPTLLFTNAGMVQFKDFFLGVEAPPQRRAVSVQKCLRVSGKHNDLENVGPSPRHHTFFEMLGNFSFGDYFKAEAIEFAWDLVTRVWGLNPQHLFASVYQTDDEAFDRWRRISGLPAERIKRLGKADNWWAMGDTGPCGPCSEIYVDRHPEKPEVTWEVGTDSGRYLEIWNLVFMQFEQAPGQVDRELPNPSIDTGAGLERVAAVLEGRESNYDTDLFQPLIAATAELAGKPYGGSPEGDVAMRVIADHLRASAFLLADGVVAGNEGRGYVLRRLLRRAVRHGMRLGFEEPFLHRLLPVVGEVLGAAYPELVATEQAAAASLRAEEEKFLATVATGSKLVQEEIEKEKTSGGKKLVGETVFRLHDTYGLPVEIIREIAEEERFTIDESGYERALEAQREKSRQSLSQTQQRLADIRRVTSERGVTWQPVEFTGYVNPGDGLERLERKGEPVLLLVRTDGGDVRVVDALQPGQEGVALFQRTPFYAESGGQVGDRGTIAWQGGAARVTDTVKASTVDYYHFVTVEKGELRGGAKVDLRVAESHRLPTQRNHTATHLLHAALRRALGEGVHQAGSLVAPDRLRFDYTASSSPTQKQLTDVEDTVNAEVLRATPVEIRSNVPIAEALAAGAMALFGEKYGERVRTVTVPGVSLELCGGCHVRNTGEIGPFAVVSEKSVASGVRRIEARTGEGALEWFRGHRRMLDEVETAVGAPAERAAAEVAALREKLRQTERELGSLRVKLVSGETAGGGGEVVVDGVKVLAREVPAAPANELRNMADVLRAKLGSGVVVLGTRADGKVSLIAAVTPDIAGKVRAGEVVKRVAPLVGGSGGGRPDFAQAGGKDAERLPEALAAVPGVVRDLLAG